MNEQYFTSLNGYYVKDKEAIHTYNSVAEMKADSKIKEGSYVKTRGYYNVNDGGNGEYLIRTKNQDDVEDNGKIHFTQNNLVAELVINGTINAKQIGCKTDGTDNSTILNNYFNEGNNQGIYFPNGNYSVSTEIDTTGSVIMDRDAYFLALNEMDCVVHINKNITNNNFVNNYPRNQELKINVNCNKLANTGIRTDKLHWANLVLTVINAVQYGVYTNYSQTPHAENNFIIQVSNDTDYNNTTTGLYVRGADDVYKNITTINCKTGVYLRSGDNSIDVIHSWINNSSLWTGSVCLKTHACKNHINNLVCDTMEMGIYLDYDGNFPFGLFIDFYYAMINSSVVSTSDSTTFKIFDMGQISNNSLNNSNLVITNYVGQDDNTAKIVLGSDGICPYNTVLGYNNDYQLPAWTYSLDYAPQGQFNFYGGNDVTGKPTGMTGSSYVIVTKNTPYGKLQELFNNQNNVNTGDTVYDENNIPTSGFIGFHKRSFNKYNNGNNCWGTFASYHVSIPTTEQE